jgi:adenosine deaminase
MTTLAAPAADDSAVILAAPKAELHLHIEGSCEPATMLRLAERNGIALPYDSPEAIAETFVFTDLASFGAAYQLGVSVMLTEEDYRDVAYSYMKAAHADNVVHAEVALAPHNHLTRGIPLEAAVEGTLAGLEEAARDFGMSHAFILGTQRYRPPELALELIEAMLPYRDRVIALGLAGLEKPFPPQPFAPVFDRARELGWKTVAHAGEEGPPAFIRDTLDVLKVDRIDHGVRAWEDPELVARLADSQVPLTVCPLSNIALRVFDTMADHSIVGLLRAGVCVTINSDDPPFFGGFVNANFQAVAAATDLSLDEQFRIARNSFVAAFIPDDLRRGYIASLDAAYVAATGRAPTYAGVSA